MPMFNMSPQQGMGQPNQPNPFAQAPMQQDPAMTQQIQMPQGAPTQPNPSFLGEGGAGRNIAGYLGDALLQYGHMNPIYGPIQQQQRALALQAAHIQQQQAAEYAKSAALHHLDVTDPTPDSYQKTYEYMAKTDPQAAERYKQAYSLRGGGLFGPTITDPNTGQQYAAPTGPAPAASAPDIDPAAVARLRSNPSEAAQFDAHFGQGASARYLGGASGNAGGNFQR